MVYRIYTEHREDFRQEAAQLLSDIRSNGIRSLSYVRIVRRFLVEGIDYELFSASRYSVFCLGGTDDVSDVMPCSDADKIIICELLPGQYDRTAEAVSASLAALCGGNFPKVRLATVYALYGDISSIEFAQIKRYLLNPAIHRECTDELPDTLSYEIPSASKSGIIKDFTAIPEQNYGDFINYYRLSMSGADVAACVDYFKNTEKRDPTITELRTIDAFKKACGGDSFFNAAIDNISINDSCIRETFEDYLEMREEVYSTAPRNISLSDISTIYARYLKRKDRLFGVNFDGNPELCSLISDSGQYISIACGNHGDFDESTPLYSSAASADKVVNSVLSSGAVPFQSIRIACAPSADSRGNFGERGRLSDDTVSNQSFAGSVEYMSQIGIPLSKSEEIRHKGYLGGRLEVSLTVGVVPPAIISDSTLKSNSVRAGDILVLVGGKTGRDGCKYPFYQEDGVFSEDTFPGSDMPICSAEIQKRLIDFFADTECSRMIRAAVPVASGGIVYAAGSIADGVHLTLDEVKLKYPGMNDTEIATSETPNRIVVCLRKIDYQAFSVLAARHGLFASGIGAVTADRRIKVEYNGRVTVSILSGFLRYSNQKKHTEAIVSPIKTASLLSISDSFIYADIKSVFASVISSENIKYSKNSIGANSQYSAEFIPGSTTDISILTYGFDPYLSDKSPYHGGVASVVEAVSKAAAAGADWRGVKLITNQYYENPHLRPESFGRALASTLGAFKAHTDLSLPLLSYKESMHGSRNNNDAPPTLISFAQTVIPYENLVTPCFKGIHSRVYLLEPIYDTDETMLPIFANLEKLFDYVSYLTKNKLVKSVYAVGAGGIAAGIYKMCSGGNIGIKFAPSFPKERLFNLKYGSFIVEAETDIIGELIGVTTEQRTISCYGSKIDIAELDKIYYSENDDTDYSEFDKAITDTLEAFAPSEASMQIKSAPAHKTAQPKVLILQTDYTFGEKVLTQKFESLGGLVYTLPIYSDKNRLNQSLAFLADAISEAQILVLPDGTSPAGIGGFTASCLKNQAVKENISTLLENEGLILGIGDGMAALVNTGLLPYGKISDSLPIDAPVISQNPSLRRYSGNVNIRVISVKSPWFSGCNTGDIFTLPVSSQSGRFNAHQSLIKKMCQNGQISTQYVNSGGQPTVNPDFNPFISEFAIESITSGDGRILGRMAHSELNSPYGGFDDKTFESAIKYFL